MRAHTWLLAAAATIAIIAPQSATAQKVTASLRGHLSGAHGEAIAGADIRLISSATGATLMSVTGEGGSFGFTGLAIGAPYTLKITAPGYVDKTLSGIALRLGETSNVEVTLETPDVETVVVAGSQASQSVIETRGVATNFDAHDIKSTPSLERDLKDIVQRSPYAVVDPVGGGARPPMATLMIAGANPRCTNLLIDGMQQKDNFGIYLNGYPTQRAPVPSDWMDQVQVAPIPYDIEYNDTCGAIINVVTKSGANDFHGTLYGFYEDSAMNGGKVGNVTSIHGVPKPDPFVQPTKPPSREISYGGTLSGPIIEDRLFFFLGYDELKQSQSTSALGATGASGSGFSKTADSIPLAQVEQIEDLAKSVYGFDTGDLTQQFPTYNQRYIGKLTWQINDSQRLIGTYQHVAGSQMVVLGGGTATNSQVITLPSAWFNNNSKMEAYSIQYLATWTSALSTQFYAGHVGTNFRPTPPGGTNFPSVFVRTPGNNGRYDLGTSTNGVIAGDPSKSTPANPLSDDGYVVFGPDYNEQYNSLFYRNNFVKAVADYAAGDHSIKAGVEWHAISIDDEAVQGVGSVVRFDSIADFGKGIIAKTLDKRTSAVASTVQSNQPVLYLNGIGGNPSLGAARFKFDIGSVFAQDEWFISKEFSVEIGLRYDRYFSNDRPALNPNFLKRYGFANSRNLDGLNALMPRVSASYQWAPDFALDPDTVVRLRAGGGKFSGGFQTVWAANCYNTSGVQTLSTNGIPGYTPGGLPVKPGAPCSSAAPFACVPGVMPVDHQQWINDLNNGPLAQSSTAVNSTVDAILPNFRLPYVWKENVGGDIMFGPGRLGDNWVATVDYFSTQNYAQAYWTNLRVMPSEQTAPDGRILYQWKFDKAAGRPDPAGQPGQITGTDIGMGSADGGGSSIITLDVKNRWEGTPYGDFGLVFGYTHSKVSDTSSAPSTSATSSYQNQAHANYNEVETGTSDYERVHRFTFNFNATEHWFGGDGWATKLNIFAQRMSGQHYSLTFNGTPFGPTGGGVAAKSLMYVPAADPATGKVTATSDPLVTFGPGFNLVGFNQMLQQTGLSRFGGRIAPRNAFSGRWSTLVNLAFEQDIPVVEGYGHLELTLDAYNFLNLLNHNWGAYQSPSSYQAYQASTATITGGKYNFTAFNTAQQLQSNFVTQRTASTYQLEVGLHYEF